MVEPSNAVLEQQIKQLRDEFIDFKKETRQDLKDMEQDIDRTRRVADEVHMSTQYVKDSVKKMESMMTSFLDVVGEQNKKIDDFVNSDKRQDSKKQFVVSILQVVGGIAVAIIGLWASGKI